MATTDVDVASGEVVSELIVRLVGTTKPREIELIADLLAAERDRRAIRPLLMRLGDSYVQEDADIEDAVCSALVALDVMCSHGNRTFFFLPRVMLAGDVVEAIRELGTAIPWRYFDTRRV